MSDNPVDYSSRSALPSQRKKNKQATIDIEFKGGLPLLELSNFRTLLLNWMGSDDFGSNQRFTHPLGSVKFTIK